MGRSHRRGPDYDLDPYEPYGRSYDTAADPYAQYPSRGRSPGPRRRNKSEPAAPPAAYDNYQREQREPEPREQPREHRESRKSRRDAVPESYDPQPQQREDRKSRKNRYYDEDAYQPRARSHGRSAREPPATAHHRADDDAFDAYAPASRRGRERQHAYHPPRTSDTRRSKYADFDAEPRYPDRRSRYAEYDNVDPYNNESRRSKNDGPRESDRRRSRYADYEGVPRGGSESNRGRHVDYEADPRSNPRGYAGHSQGGRGRYMNDSPERYGQPGGGQQRSARGRSMPRKGAAGGTSGTARPRAKSAVGYAALGEAAQTAFRVGSQAALQMKSEPGPWIGEKGTRVATAALGAALVDTFVGHKATGMKGGMRHQALRQACEMGIRNFVVQPTVNTATRRSGSWGGHGTGSGGGQSSSGRRRH